MSFWSKISDWIYDITEPVDKGFRAIGRGLVNIIGILLIITGVRMPSLRSWKT